MNPFTTSHARRELILLKKQLIWPMDNTVEIFLNNDDLRTGMSSDHKPLADLCGYFFELNPTSSVLAIDLTQNHQYVYFRTRDLESKNLKKMAKEMKLMITLYVPKEAGLEGGAFAFRGVGIPFKAIAGASEPTTDNLLYGPGWSQYQDKDNVPFAKGDFGYIEVSFAWELEVHYLPIEKGLPEKMYEQRAKTADFLIVGKDASKDVFRCHRAPLEVNGILRDAAEIQEKHEIYNLPALRLKSTPKKGIELLLQCVYDREIDLCALTCPELCEGFKVTQICNQPGMRDAFFHKLMMVSTTDWSKFIKELVKLCYFAGQESFVKQDQTCKEVEQKCFAEIHQLEVRIPKSVYECEYFKERGSRNGKQEVLEQRVNAYVADKLAAGLPI